MVPDLIPEHPVIIGAALAAAVALVVFFLKDLVLQSSRDRRKDLRDWNRRRLLELYGPLYRFYSEGFAEFDAWKCENPESQLPRGPFFTAREIEAVTGMLEGREALASPQVLRGWRILKAAQTAGTRRAAQSQFVVIVVREYQDLRRSLGLGYDRRERRSGVIEPVRATR